MKTLETWCRCALLFFVVRPGDLVVAEGTLQLLYRHRMVCFPKALKNERERIKHYGLFGCF